MFSTTVPHITLPYSADRHFVAIGNTTWQTKNIAAVSVAGRKLPLEVPEPRFKEKKPVPQTNWRYIVYGVPVVGFITLGTGGNVILGAALLIALLGLVAFVRIYGYRHLLNEWAKQKANSARAHKAWLRLRSSVPTAYTLILDTSSGKSVAMTTFDASLLEEVRSAILFAMSGESEKKIAGQLKAVDLDSQKLDDLYTNYCLHQMS